MSASTFLLILAAVIVVFVGYVVKSWSALGTASRIRPRKKTGKRDEDRGSGKQD
ncbi:MAG: hypothetical protein U5R46_10745 [Gammaproteobacteria bacterium]|nr:hypothetical protein [Gammaproteobacteria bacterium]